MSRARDLADRVLHNRTHEDTEGGRESILTFKGEQSGGEISTLAQIQASHDGTSDDEKSDLIFKTNDGSDGASPTEAMRIDSGQNVLIGKSDAETTISGATPAFQITGAGFDAAAAITRREANAFGASMVLAKSRNTTPNNFTIVQDGDVLGSLIFIGDDGTNLDTYGATITAKVDGTAGANDLPSRLEFAVTHDGAASPTEKLRIDEDGLKFNGDTAAANALSDYETGSSSATVVGSSGGSITISGDKTVFYTKIGDMVQFQGEFHVTSVSGASGAIQIDLPFTSLDYAAGALRCYSAVFGGTSPFCEVHTAGTKLYFSSSSSNAGTQPILSNGYYFFSISYRTT